MRRLPLFAFLLTAPAAAQSVYDFNSLMGDDNHPFVPLDGQDGWSEETFNASNPTGVTATLGHDGTKSLQFQEVGPGFGSDASRINDASWSFPAFNGTESNASFQVDMLTGFWGGSFGIGHDTNGNGQIRGSEAGEIGVRFVLGTQMNVQIRLVDTGGTSSQAQLAPLGIAGGQWIRVRVVMDLGANGGTGLGSVEVMNLTAGQTAFTPVAGLQGVPLGLSQAALDASNPTNWDALWLHFEGATYGIDNVEIGLATVGSEYCSSNVNSTGSVTGIHGTGSTSVAANDLVLHATSIPNNAFGFFITSQTQGFVTMPAMSQGNLCLAGAIGRYVGAGQIMSSGNDGTISLPLDLAQTPQPNGLVAVAAGETWNFQLWHRDFTAAPTSNFSNGLEVSFTQ